jgi:tetratricopeptide (TPR) repeat protein
MLNGGRKDRASRTPPLRVVSGRVAWAGRISFWSLVLTLCGTNVWWAWDSMRPLASLSNLRTWIDQNRLNDAEREARRWLRQFPHHGEARILLSRILAANGDSLASAEQLHQVPLWWPSKREVLVLEGQNFLRADCPRNAEAAWKAALADDALHPVSAASVTTAAVELSRLYIVEGRLDEARDVLWARYEMAEPAGRQFFLAKLLRLELEREAPATAAAILMRYVKVTPNDWDARRALARAEQSLGQSALASRDILACLKARPNDLRIWRDRLAILVAQDDLDGLVDAVAQLPAAAAQDGECWKFRGLAHLHRQDWSPAMNAFEKALELEPGKAECHGYLVRIAERLGNPQKADYHRRQCQALVAASAELPAALHEALESIRNPQPGALPPAFTRVIALYKTLGQTREATAWSRSLPSSDR